MLTEQGFVDFVHAHEHLAFRRARSLLPEEDAREVVQDAFVGLWESRTRLRDTTLPTLRDYLLTAVKNRSIDRLRARQSRPPLTSPGDDDDGEPLLDRQAAPDLSPDDQLWLAESDDRVRRALTAIGPRYQPVATLYFLAGLSVSEVAERLAESETHTRGLIRVARERLQAHLTPVLVEQALATLTDDEQIALRRHYADLNAGAMSSQPATLEDVRERFLRRLTPDLAPLIPVRERLALQHDSGGASLTALAAALTTWEAANTAREQARRLNRGRATPATPAATVDEAAASRLLQQAIASLERLVREALRQ